MSDQARQETTGIVARSIKNNGQRRYDMYTESVGAARFCINSIDIREPRYSEYRIHSKEVRSIGVNAKNIVEKRIGKDELRVFSKDMRRLGNDRQQGDERYASRL